MVLIKLYYRELILGLLLITTSAVATNAQNVEKMIRKEVQSLYENAALVPLNSDIGSVDLHDGDQVFRIFDSSSNTVKGYVLSTSAMGRFDAFDYFLVFSEALEVQLVKVAVYRSAHGSAICSKRWLKQFEGYKGGDLTYGKDVQAVSGATISGGSIVADVQRARRMMAALKEDAVLKGN